MSLILSAGIAVFCAFVIGTLTLPKAIWTFKFKVWAKFIDEMGDKIFAYLRDL